MSNRRSPTRRFSAKGLAGPLLLGLMAMLGGARTVRATDPAVTRAPRTPNRSTMPAANKTTGKPKTVQFSCADALEDGTLTDSRVADLLSEQASTLRWEGGYGLPNTCHREVHLICGPDLDHDGDPEGIVQIDWWQALDGLSCANLKSSADYWPVSYTFLATKHLSRWRAVATLGVGIFGDSEQLQRRAGFVRLAKHQLGIMAGWSNVSSDNGCQIAGYEIFTLRAGTLEKTATRDESPPCTPCCDPP